MKIEVVKDREIICDIIYKNIKLIEKAGNKKQICQELADCILVYFVEKEEIT